MRTIQPVILPTSGSVRNGVIEVSGIVLPVGDEFTHSQLVAGSISFRHDGGETTSAVAEFSVSDGSLTSSSALLNITVSPVNDAPELILTSEPLRVLEGGLLQLGTIQISADDAETQVDDLVYDCLLYTSPSPRDRQKSRMPSSA